MHLCTGRNHMSSRTRLLLSIGIPVLLIIVVVAAFLWQQRAVGSGTQHPVPSTFSTECAALSKATPPQQLTSMSLALDWTPNTNHTGIYVGRPVQGQAHARQLLE